jgi:hypothetical protein
MKIDIGRGKILGTKEVSANGQISGFKDYAGREVLVILPAEETEVEPDPAEVVEEVKLATQHHMRVAFNEYEQAKDRFRGPGEATRRFLEDHTPDSFQGLYGEIERWLGEQTGKAEDRVREALDAERPEPALADDDPTEPDKEEIE